MQKISFLILANNESKTIKKEIKKILELKKKLKFNLVIVQDGSTDGTYEILNKISKKKVYCITKKNGLDIIMPF